MAVTASWDVDVERLSSDAPAPASDLPALAYARAILRAEADAVRLASRRLDLAIVRVARRVVGGFGSVIVTGMGKAGLVGQKLAATLTSTGTPAFPLHPGDAIHGDLGRVRAGDVVLILSFSGETEEVLRLLPALRRQGAFLVAITAKPSSTLGRGADETIALGPIEEACPHGLAPTASTTVMIAVGDALALLVARLRGFRPEDFARFHPGGALGRKLGKVEEVMRTGPRVRIAQSDEPVRSAFFRLRGASRRSGAILVVDPAGRLAGIFTDSDLARLVERRREHLLDKPIEESMTPDPVRIERGRSIAEAIDLLNARKLSELPVVDADGRPVGLVDITDLLGLAPNDPVEHVG